MVAATAVANRSIRPLEIDDIERVIAIDRDHSGYSRRRFFEKRFAAVAAKPDDYLHIGVMRGGSLRGFAIARILRGEFGHEHAVAVLDAIGVEAESQERGIGQALMDGLGEIMRCKGVRSLQSQADWTNHGLLRFFHAVGFQLASRVALQRPVNEVLVETSEEV
jgi:ribosomal protein S18 acetylase RimI-like enzyme